MIRLGIDTRMIGNSGIGTYLRGLLEGLSTHPSIKANTHLFGGPMSPDLQVQGWKTQNLSDPIYSLKEQIAYFKTTSRCHIWHAPHYNVPYFKGRCKLIVTIHDVIHWIFRKQFLNPVQRAYASVMLRRAVRNSDHILTVSESTKNDLIRYFQADPNKITVTYEGISKQFKPISDQEVIAKVLGKYKIEKPYYLYLGLLKPHKNVPWLIKNFTELKKAQKIAGKLVLIGKRDEKYPSGHEIMGQLEQLNEVIHIQRADFEDLPVLYNQARALVHPSLYEGFGLTMLEAMACGTPVIASNAASIPEVVGEAGILVQPTRDEEIKDALLRMETDEVFRQELKEKGFEQVRKFSWQRMSDQTAEIYERLGNS